MGASALTTANSLKFSEDLLFVIFTNFLIFSLSFVSFLATTSADTTVNIWQTADFSLSKTLKETSQRWVWDCAFSEDSQYLITGNNEN